ncbi:PTS sugar transporter subunit IIB [Anaerococcus porci]|uniref:PTS system mannose/fructose/N-acetylgalactosamine-transporter subunit IIB n=1 Tax=Anaerococcus porci TaxID=2652269 RepID=UPI002A752AE2|nr:PTS sugar transporter subunit IIB [Anaerococcus porci]MDY3005572.1 PTS sugar transporter subunit IIB [Anaerococcus porci]
MAEVVLTRIDDRLLHGQVSKKWLNEVKANTIIVADDKIAEDSEKIKILNVATPIGIKSYFLSIADAIDKLKHLEEDIRAILLVENTKSALEIIDKGLNIDKINLGNQRRRIDTKEITQSIYLKDEEIKDLEKIEEKGIKVMILTLPEDKLIKVSDIN